MATAGVLFWKKNKIDLDNDNVTITVTDSVATNTGQSFANLMRNRNNTSGWRTTGSNDAANTTLVIEMVDSFDIDNILLISHNLAAFTIKYWNGSIYTDFSTPISETVNTEATNRYTFVSVNTSRIQIIITGTQVTDDDKQIAQLIITELIGQLDIEPEIKGPIFDKNKKITRFVSGKYHIKRTVGAIEFRLRKKNVIDTDDLSAIESLFDQPRGFLTALHGFNISQYRTQRQGFRLQDIFYVHLSSDYEPQWDSGRFQHGTNIDLSFREVN